MYTVQISLMRSDIEALDIRDEVFGVYWSENEPELDDNMA